MSSSTKSPNYLDCEAEYKDQQVHRIRYLLNQEARSNFLYLGIYSRYGQPISIKPVYGEFTSTGVIQRRGSRFKSSKDVSQIKSNSRRIDIFKKAESQLFDKMTDEERQDEIKEIMLRKQRKMFELAKGKDFISINRIKANLFRATNLKKRYLENSVFFTNEDAL